MGKIINAINLTTGLEFLPEVCPDCFTRLQSSHLEGKHWQRFLDSVDANIWYELARGSDVVVHDCGSRQKNGVPRTIWQGIPFLRYVAQRAWDIDPDRPEFKGHNVTEYMEGVYLGLNVRGVKYFRKHLSSNAVSLSGRSKLSLLDGRN